MNDDYDLVLWKFVARHTNSQVHSLPFFNALSGFSVRFLEYSRIGLYYARVSLFHSQNKRFSLKKDPFAQLNYVIINIYKVNKYCDLQIKNLILKNPRKFLRIFQGKEVFRWFVTITQGLRIFKSFYFHHWLINISYLQYLQISTILMRVSF